MDFALAPCSICTRAPTAASEADEDKLFPGDTPSPANSCELSRAKASMSSVLSGSSSSSANGNVVLSSLCVSTTLVRLPPSQQNAALGDVPNRA
eukprot:scaffold259_cov578-Prasinococcus_capsulatus_cf.AAC.4